MSFAQAFVPEFQQEMSGARSILELVPENLMDWKAHEKMRTIGWVASHLVDIVSWAEVTMNETEFDVAPPDGPPHESPLLPASELVPAFDKHLTRAVELFENGSDEDFAVPWSLKQGGGVLFTMPRMQIVKMFFLNHVIHHRAFLVSYLRMNDVECPNLYG